MKISLLVGTRDFNMIFHFNATHITYTSNSCNFTITLYKRNFYEAPPLPSNFSFQPLLRATEDTTIKQIKRTAATKEATTASLVT